MGAWVRIYLRTLSPSPPDTPLLRSLVTPSPQHQAAFHPNCGAETRLPAPTNGNSTCVTIILAWRQCLISEMKLYGVKRNYLPLYFICCLNFYRIITKISNNLHPCPPLYIPKMSVTVKSKKSTYKMWKTCHSCSCQKVRLWENKAIKSLECLKTQFDLEGKSWKDDPVT